MTKVVEKVYILESFGADEPDYFKKEALDLIDFLDSESIEHEFYKFTNSKELISILSPAGGKLFDKEKEDGVLYIPYLHFICHGNEEGIVARGCDLIGDDFISWDELNKILFGFSYNASKFDSEPVSSLFKTELEKLGHLQDKESLRTFDSLFQNYKLCYTFLNLSSCHGAHIAEKAISDLANFSFVIGSRKETYSSETGPAFNEFYRSIKHDKDSFIYTLYKMNDYMKNGQLEIFISDEMKQMFLEWDKER